MPGDVAVEQPGARIVGVEGDGDPAGGGEHGDIAARPACAKLKVGRALVKCALTDTEDDEVVAVEVQRVGNGELGLVLNDPESPLSAPG